MPLSITPDFFKTRQFAGFLAFAETTGIRFFRITQTKPGTSLMKNKPFRLGAIAILRGGVEAANVGRCSCKSSVRAEARGPG